MVNGMPPVILSPNNNSSLQTLRPTFTGKSVPSARVVAQSDTYAIYYGDCYADAQGNWSFVPNQNMTAGTATYKFAHFGAWDRVSADTPITLTLSA